MQTSSRRSPADQTADAQRSKKDWIGEQFKRVYDDTAEEPLPDDMQELLDALDDVEPSDNQTSGAKNDE